MSYLASSPELIEPTSCRLLVPLPTRRTPLILLLFLSLFLPIHGAYATPWHPLFQSSLVAVSVKESLYEKEGSPYFFIKFRIENLSKEILGVDLSHRRPGMLYPNQWGCMHASERAVVNEVAAYPPALTEARASVIKKQYRDGHFDSIRPGESLQYFADFNANGRKRIEGQCTGAKYLYVSIRGELVVTNGVVVESLPSGPSNYPSQIYDLVLKLPVQWAAIPSNARVREDEEMVFNPTP